MPSRMTLMNSSTEAGDVIGDRRRACASGARNMSRLHRSEGAKRASGARKGRETPVNTGHLRSTTDTRKPAPTRRAAL